MQYAQNVVICEIKWAPVPIYVGTVPVQYVQLRAVIISGGDQQAVIAKNGRALSENDISAIKNGGDIIQTRERKGEVDAFAEQLISQGWESAGQGPNWYSYRFAKKYSYMAPR